VSDLDPKGRQKIIDDLSQAAEQIKNGVVAPPPCVPRPPLDLFSRTREQVAGWVLTKAEYASIDYHDTKQHSSVEAQGFATEAASLLLMVLARIGIRIPQTPAMDPNDSHFDLSLIRGYIRELFGWRGGPKHEEDFDYGQ